MLRVSAKDVLASLRCGSRRHMLAAITDGLVIRRILMHLGLPTEPPPVAPARGPPPVAPARGPLPIAPARAPPQREFAW